ERGALTMTRCRTVEHRANCMNGLAITANDSPDVGLAELHFKDCHFATRNFGQYHVVWKFDQLADDELEELLHNGKVNHEFTRIDTNLISLVSRLKILCVFANGTNFFAVGTQ